jgi:hypothetical protein
MADGRHGSKREKPRVPMDAVRSPATPGRKNPLPPGAQQAELKGGKSQRHLQHTDQVGCPSCYFGAQSQVQIQRID